MSVNAVDETPDVAAGFAAMMNEAAEQAGAPAEDAPYGYTTDPDGTRRPKKAAGRPRKPPAIEELKEQREVTADSDPASQGSGEGDRAPDTTRRQRKRGMQRDPKPEKPVPQFREGVIAKGVNKLYRRGGKIIRVMDPEIGQAIISITIKDTLPDGRPDPEDITVGEAWEELARTNPRIRRFLMKIIAGGAWGQLFMAHAPVLMAVLMKDAIRKRIPFMAFIESLAEPDDDTPDGEGGLPGGMTADDIREASRLAQEQMARAGMPIPPEVAAQMEAMVARNGTGPPPGTPSAFIRKQPKHRSRAERAGVR